MECPAIKSSSGTQLDNLVWEVCEHLHYWGLWTSALLRSVNVCVIECERLRYWGLWTSALLSKFADSRSCGTKKNCPLYKMVGSLHAFPRITSVQAPILARKKRFYYLTSVIIMYYIMSLAKFGNCCSMVWAHRQGQWKGKNFGIPFSKDDDCNGVKCPHLQRFGKATFCVLWIARRANQPLESNHESSVQSQACSMGIKVYQVLKHYALSWYKLWRQNAHEFYYKPTRDSHECIIQFNENS